MSLTVHRDITQRSDEWYALRLGMVTASTVGGLITPVAIKVLNGGRRHRGNQIVSAINIYHHIRFFIHILFLFSIL